METYRLVGSKAGFDLESAFTCRKPFAQSQPNEICASQLRAAFIVCY